MKGRTLSRLIESGSGREGGREGEPGSKGGGQKNGRIVSRAIDMDGWMEGSKRSRQEVVNGWM